MSNNPKEERRIFKLPGQDGDGLKCRACGCRDLRVVNTYPFTDGKKVRRRQCRHCGLIVRTCEAIEADESATE